jgi:ATP-dependent 26S proteasome regulatory subunit
MKDAEQLRKLLAGFTPCIGIVTPEETYVRQIVTEAVLPLNMDLYSWTVIEGVRQGLEADGPTVAETEHPAAGLLYLTHLDGRFIAVVYDLAEHLKDTRTLRIIRDLITRFEYTGSKLILIDHQEQLPFPVRSYTERFELTLPDAPEIEAIVRNSLREYHHRNPIEVDITRAELNTIIRNLSGLTRRQIRQIILDLVAESNRFDRSDINRLLAEKRQMLRGDGLLEYIETPAELNEIGGLQRLKRWLKLRQDTLSDEAAQFGLTAPRGVLMLGVQGAGKSLCAKAIATAWQRPLLRLDSGSLYDPYIGESERHLRTCLRQAEMMAPIILWIDEIEKAFASAASRSSDGGLSQRLFGSLLTWMQEHQAPVFLVATANDIEALPPELLRKGRFDEIFFVDLPKKETRRDIFAIHLKKRHRDPKLFDLDKLAEAAEGFSGAEIEQAVIAALHESYAQKKDLTNEFIIDAVKNSPPLSVTMAEKVEALRQWAKNRCTPAD